VEGERAEGQVAAFFDLDRTLIPFNSALAYARHEYRARRLSLLQFVQSGVWMGLYHLSLVDLTKAFDKAVGFYRGVESAVLAERTRSWFLAEIVHELLPAARVAMERHRAAGHRVVLLSSTSSYMAELAMEHWGFDGWLANRFRVDEAGRLTGEAEQPLCFADGKVLHAKRYAAEYGVDLQRSYFYTDSFSDRAMLEAVDGPRVVNPDPRLRRYAKRRGWPVEDWAR
jgi:HAD superfamily hydrolase (TIGR01490 family)